MKPLLCTHRSVAPPDRIWEVASDFARAADRIKAITKVEMLTPGPVGVGTRFREWRGRHDVDMEIVAWSPPRSYSLRGYAMGTEFMSEIRCVPDPARAWRWRSTCAPRPSARSSSPRSSR